MEFMNTYFQNIFIDALYGLSTIGIYYLISYIRKKIGTEEMIKLESEYSAKLELAKLAVQYAEQHGIDINVKGEEKVILAYNWLSDRLEEKGYNISPDEINGLVKSALRELKNIWGDEWSKVVK